MITENRVRPLPASPGSAGLLALGFLLLAFCCARRMASQAAANPRELLDAGRADDALRLLAPQATGNNAEAFNYLCRAYFSLYDWDNAVRNCERAAQLEPGNAIFQLWLGRSYGEKANVSRATYLPPTRWPAKPWLLSSPHARSTAADIAIARDLAEYYATAPAIVGGGSDKALVLAAELAPEHPSDAAWVRAMVAANARASTNRLNTSTPRPSASITTPPAPISILPATCADGKTGIASRSTVEHAMRSPRIRPGRPLRCRRIAARHQSQSSPGRAADARLHPGQPHRRGSSALSRSLSARRNPAEEWRSHPGCRRIQGRACPGQFLSPRGRISPPPGATLKPARCARLRRNTTGP